MTSREIQRAFYRATRANDLPLVCELILRPELRGISTRFESLHQAIEHDQLELVQALVSDRPITEAQEHEGDEAGYQSSELCRPILTKSLAKNDPEYWIAVRPYVIETFDFGDLEKCSLQLLRYLDDHDQISGRSWISILRDCDEIARFQDIWQIRFPANVELTDTDRELIQRLAIALVSYRELLPLATAKMDHIYQVYPGVISGQEDIFLEKTFIPDHENGGNDHPEMIAWLFQNDQIDLKPWLTKMLPRIVEEESCAGCVELLIAKTRFYPVQYLHDFGAKIGLLVSRDPPVRLGWTSFMISGHYFYSSNIYLDLVTRRLIRGWNYGLVLPDIDGGELAYPEQEHLVEIAYGPDYCEMITIPAPTFLLDWYRDSGITTKGAQA